MATAPCSDIIFVFLYVFALATTRTVDGAEDGNEMVRQRQPQQQQMVNEGTGGVGVATSQAVAFVGRLMEVPIGAMRMDGADNCADRQLFGIQDLPPWLMHNTQQGTLLGIPTFQHLGQSVTLTLQCRPSEDSAWQSVAHVTVSVMPALQSDFRTGMSSTSSRASAGSDLVTNTHLFREGPESDDVQSSLSSDIKDRSYVQNSDSSNGQPSSHFDHDSRKKFRPENQELLSASGDQDVTRTTRQQENKQCAQDHIASLVLCISPETLNISRRVQVMQKAAEFLSIPASSLTWMSSIDGSLLFTGKDYSVQSGGASDGNACTESVNSELSWPLSCSAGRHVTEFCKILQHNVEVGRIQREVGVEVLGWYVASKGPRLGHRRRRRRVSNRTPTPTPTLYPSSATLWSASVAPSPWVEFTDMDSLTPSSQATDAGGSVFSSQPIADDSSVSTTTSQATKISTLAVSSTLMLDSSPSFTEHQYLSASLVFTEDVLMSSQSLSENIRPVASSSSIASQWTQTQEDAQSLSTLQSSLSHSSVEMFMSTPVTVTPSLSSVMSRLETSAAVSGEVAGSVSPSLEPSAGVHVSLSEFGSFSSSLALTSRLAESQVRLASHSIDTQFLSLTEYSPVTSATELLSDIVATASDLMSEAFSPSPVHSFSPTTQSVLPVMPAAYVDDDEEVNMNYSAIVSLMESSLSSILISSEKQSSMDMSVSSVRNMSTGGEAMSTMSTGMEDSYTVLQSSSSIDHFTDVQTAIELTVSSMPSRSPEREAVSTVTMRMEGSFISMQSSSSVEHSTEVQTIMPSHTMGTSIQTTHFPTPSATDLFSLSVSSKTSLDRSVVIDSPIFLSLTSDGIPTSFTLDAIAVQTASHQSLSSMLELVESPSVSSFVSFSSSMAGQSFLSSISSDAQFSITSRGEIKVDESDTIRDSSSSSLPSVSVGPTQILSSTTSLTSASDYILSMTTVLPFSEGDDKSQSFQHDSLLPSTTEGGMTVSVSLHPSPESSSLVSVSGSSPFESYVSMTERSLDIGSSSSVSVIVATPIMSSVDSFSPSLLSYATSSLPGVSDIPMNDSVSSFIGLNQTDLPSVIGIVSDLSASQSLQVTEIMHTAHNTSLSDVTLLSTSTSPLPVSALITSIGSLQPTSTFGIVDDSDLATRSESMSASLTLPLSLNSSEVSTETVSSTETALGLGPVSHTAVSSFVEIISSTESLSEVSSFSSGVEPVIQATEMPSLSSVVLETESLPTVSPLTSETQSVILATVLSVSETISVGVMLSTTTSIPDAAATSTSSPMLTTSIAVDTTIAPEATSSFADSISTSSIPDSIPTSSFADSISTSSFADSISTSSIPDSISTSSIPDSISTSSFPDSISTSLTTSSDIVTPTVIVLTSPATTTTTPSTSDSDQPSTTSSTTVDDQSSTTTTTTSTTMTSTSPTTTTTSTTRRTTTSPTTTTVSTTDRTSSTSSSTSTQQESSTTVTDTTVGGPNNPPIVLNPMTYLPTMLGCYFQWQIPEDMFYDVEDGTTRALALTLTLPYDEPLPYNFWVQFDRSRQVVYGLPLVADLDMGYHSVVVVATDSLGLSARNPVSLYVNSSAFNHFTHRFVMTFGVDFSEIMRRRDNVTRLLKRIGSYYGDEGAEYVTVVDVSVGSFVLSWTNSTLSGSQCPNRTIQNNLQRMVRRDGSIRSAFNRHIGKHLKLRSITFHPEGACLHHPTPPPVTTTTISSADGTKIHSRGSSDSDVLKEIILPVLVALLLVLLIVILVLFVHRCRHRRGTMETMDKDLYTADRSPVILPGEIPDVEAYNVRPKKPAILPYDQDRETSSFPRNRPNTYEHYRQIGSFNRAVNRPSSYAFDDDHSHARPVTVIFNNFDSVPRQSRPPSYWNERSEETSPNIRVPPPYLSTTSV